MELKKKRQRLNPETKATKGLKDLMVAHGWSFVKIHGNKYQMGLPDVYAYHIRHGYRWIEVKIAPNFLEHTQVVRFKDMSRQGIGVWILRGREDYDLLFRPPNYLQFIQLRYKCFNLPKRDKHA
jgi:hypothetical protein